MFQFCVFCRTPAASGHCYADFVTDLEMYPPSSWQYVLYGMEFKTAQHASGVSAASMREARDEFRTIAQMAERALADLPPHRALVEHFCNKAASAGNGATAPPPQEEAAAEPAPEPEPKAAPARKPSKSSSKAKAAAGNGSRTAAALRVSPIARRMADEAGIDLAAMAGRGSGPEGRVVKADVERLISSGELTRPAAADAPPATESAPAEGEIRELTPMLKAVATRMTQSKQTVPHFYVESEIDMTRAMQLRAELNSGLAESGDKISVNDLIVRAQGPKITITLNGTPTVEYEEKQPDLQPALLQGLLEGVAVEVHGAPSRS